MANPNGNIANLRTLSTDEARKIGRKGGIASGKARRQRRTLQQIAKAILSLPMEPGDVVDIDPEIHSMASLEGVNLDLGTAALLAAARKAVEGDLASLRLLIDTAGERPAERVEVSADIAQAEAELAQIIERMDLKGRLEWEKEQERRRQAS